MDTKDLIALAAEISRKNREERRLRSRRITRRADRARKEVERLVAAFRQADPGLHTVILFGSFAENRMRDERFDIDMAISSRNYLGCLSVALDSEFKVDLVDLDTVRPVLRDQIEHHGKVGSPLGCPRQSGATAPRHSARKMENDSQRALRLPCHGRAHRGGIGGNDAMVSGVAGRHATVHLVEWAKRIPSPEGSVQDGQYMDH